jgi:hypothetical protein
MSDPQQEPPKPQRQKKGVPDEPPVPIHNTEQFLGETVQIAPGSLTGKRKRRRAIVKR